MVIHEFLRSIRATAAATTDRQVGLHLAQRIGASIHGVANLAIGYRVAYANIHGGFSVNAAGAAPKSNVNANANDCQLP
jgi:hypothetical protein